MVHEKSPKDSVPAWKTDKLQMTHFDIIRKMLFHLLSANILFHFFLCRFVAAVNPFAVDVCFLYSAKYVAGRCYAVKSENIINAVEEILFSPFYT